MYCLSTLLTHTHLVSQRTAPPRLTVIVSRTVTLSFSASLLLRLKFLSFSVSFTHP